MRQPVDVLVRPQSGHHDIVARKMDELSVADPAKTFIVIVEYRADGCVTWKELGT